MNTALNAEFISISDYLAGEEESDVRHEYVGGVLYAMAGASWAHHTIALNLSSRLHPHLRGGPCRMAMSDIKLRLTHDGETFYYPDLLVTCDPRDTDPLYARHPKILVEILSDSTQRIDRIEKFNAYTKIESLEIYVLVAQDAMDVKVFRRVNEWRLETYGSPDELLQLDSIRFSIFLRDLYAGVF